MHTLTAFLRPAQRSLALPPWYPQHPDHGNDKRSNSKAYEPLASRDTDVEEAEIDGLTDSGLDVKALERRLRRPRLFSRRSCCLVLV